MVHRSVVETAIIVTPGYGMEHYRMGVAHKKGLFLSCSLKATPEKDTGASVGTM